MVSLFFDVSDGFRDMVLRFGFAMIGLVHFSMVVLDGETPLLAISWFEVIVASYFGAIACILPALTHQVGADPAPAPVITTHRFYQPIEIAISLGSLVGLATVVLLGARPRNTVGECFGV